MTAFLDVQPSLANEWRALILFGRNVASYKFALARSLLELGARENDLIRMDELAEPFARHICRHLSTAPRQTTSQTSRFVESCRRANAGEVSVAELRDTTVRFGFNNVVDAFHRLGPADLETRFFIDERSESAGLRLTDDMYRLLQSGSAADLDSET